MELSKAGECRWWLGRVALPVSKVPPPLDACAGAPILFPVLELGTWGMEAFLRLV